MGPIICDPKFYSSFGRKKRNVVEIKNELLKWISLPHFWRTHSLIVSAEKKATNRLSVRTRTSFAPCVSLTLPMFGHHERQTLPSSSLLYVHRYKDVMMSWKSKVLLLLPQFKQIFLFSHRLLSFNALPLLLWSRNNAVSIREWPSTLQSRLAERERTIHGKWAPRGLLVETHCCSW